jgi:ADP-ribose pyrophosphatase YjhB (NUDIX family)
VFDDVSAQLVSTATALLNWHDHARFSAADGSPTKSSKSGWSRVNLVTGHEEFPRIDPAIICLVHDGHDRAVLARQTMWPERLFSLLAGFVEAGESFESCVVREIAEEVGLTVRDVRYLGSQPWPFPRSLMVGFHAVGDPEQEFSFNDGEIAEAGWFTRAEVRAALADGDWSTSSTSASRLLLPGSISIAREIIESWAAQDCSSSELGRYLTCARVGQRRAVGELHRRHHVIAAVDRAHELGRGRIGLDVDLGPGDSLGLQGHLEARAEATPAGGVHGQTGRSRRRSGAHRRFNISDTPNMPDMAGAGPRHVASPCQDGRHAQ